MKPFFDTESTGHDAMLKRITLNEMRKHIRKLRAGLVTIGECEYDLNETITTAALGISDDNAKQRFFRVMKRRCWRMLLNATSLDNFYKEDRE